MSKTLLSITRRIFLAAVLLSVGAPNSRAQAQSDPLPSWSDGAAKKAIMDFVGRVTREGGPDFVPVPERIATFDNDGTLWTEQPYYFQLAFAIDRIKAMAPQHPEWKTRQPFKALLAGDKKALAAAGKDGLLQIIAATHAGMTVEEFYARPCWTGPRRRNIRGSTGLYRADLPADARIADLPARQRLQDLHRLWRRHRVHAALDTASMAFRRSRWWGRPAWSSSRSTPDGKTSLLKLPKIEFIDDGPGKPVGINRFIGRRPILAFGNSDGDLQMLQYTADGSGTRFMGIVHHTDAEREYAYDRQSPIGKLDKALDEAARRGWTVVDMKRDWKTIFPPAK